MTRLYLQGSPYTRSRSALETAAGLVAAGLLVSIAGTGHAAASVSAGFPFRLGADAFHLFAAAIWPTGLLPFALFLSYAPVDSGACPPRVTLTAVRRFSNLSLIVVGMLVATGTINSFFLVGSFPALVTTLYGRILCLKLLLLLIILVIASWNRFRLLPRLFASSGPMDVLLRRLRYFVAIEFVLAVAIVAVVSVLGITPPPG